MEKIEELMGINSERKRRFRNNIVHGTKIKTLSSYSEDKYYPQAYMEEFKYERIEVVFHFDSDLIVIDSNSDFE